MKDPVMKDAGELYHLAVIKRRLLASQDSALDDEQRRVLQASIATVDAPWLVKALQRAWAKQT